MSKDSARLLALGAILLAIVLLAVIAAVVAIKGHADEAIEIGAATTGLVAVLTAAVMAWRHESGKDDHL